MIYALGIEASKILDFYKYYNATIPFMNVYKKMKMQTGEIDGLILGISHAEVGIIPEILGRNFVSLAVSS